VLGKPPLIADTSTDEHVANIPLKEFFFPTSHD